MNFKCFLCFNPFFVSEFKLKCTKKQTNGNKLYLMLVCNYRSKCNPEHRLKVHKRFIQLTTYPRDSIG